MSQQHCSPDMVRNINTLMQTSGYKADSPASASSATSIAGKPAVYFDTAALQSPFALAIKPVEAGVDQQPSPGLVSLSRFLTGMRVGYRATVLMIGKSKRRTAILTAPLSCHPVQDTDMRREVSLLASVTMPIGGCLSFTTSCYHHSCRYGTCMSSTSSPRLLI